MHVRLRGRGRVEVAGYGMADAEHQVEKEIARLWPEARVEVLQVARPEGAARIVESFLVHFRLHASLPVEEAEPQRARAAALRLARARLAGSRYARTEWEQAEVEAR